MRIALSWLKRMVDCRLSAPDLAGRLTMAGLEVEAFEEPVPAAASSAMAALIERVTPHPAADRLLVCQVSIGRGRRTEVVSGAPDVHAGQVVAYAPPGTRLADGSPIEPVEIRGVESCGMLCSEADLGLGEDGSRLLRLPPSVRPGTAVAAALGLGGWILDVSATPNRGDCLSVVGVAREVAAVTGGRMNPSFPALPEGRRRARDRIRVRIEAPDLCPRYAVRLACGLRMGRSPLWLRHHLEVAGIRAINVVVDVTNFVMLELGQPLHAFDLSKISGNQIVVRRASRDERIRTLDGGERRLAPDDLVICDRAEPIALAGIMGGENSQIGDTTEDVLLESAFFVPSTIRATRRRLGLSSESSYRFERGVDPKGVVAALDRAAGLLHDLAQGEVCKGVVEARGERRRPVVIRLEPRRVGALLGMKMTAREVSRRLRSLGASVEHGRQGELIVTSPSHRFDLAAEVDLIEEVARLKGYDHIPAALPHAEIAPEPPSPARLTEGQVRGLLLGHGLSEMILLPFVSAQDNQRFKGWVWSDGRAPVRLLNPLSREQGELRQSLLPGLLGALKHNLNRGEAGVAAFCVGRVYSRGPDGECSERRLVAGAMCGRRPVRGLGAQRVQSDFFQAKGVVESLVEALRLPQVTWERGAGIEFLHPGKAAQVRVGHDVCAILGALHPKLQEELALSVEPWLFELDLRVAVHYAPRRSIFQPLPRYPAVRRDVSLVVREGLPAGEIVGAIEALGNELIEEVNVFDQYRGAQIAEGYKSLTYSIAYRAPDRTLTDEEVNQVHGQVVQEITQRFGIAVRT